MDNIPKWSTINHYNRNVIFLNCTFVGYHLITSSPLIRRQLLYYLGSKQNYAAAESRLFSVRQFVSMITYFGALYYYHRYTRNDADDVQIPFMVKHKIMFQTIGIALKVSAVFMLSTLNKSQPNASSSLDPDPPVYKRKQMALSPQSVFGILRITRHPLLWSIFGCYFGDFLLNGPGYLNDAYLCLPLSFLCVFGMYRQDLRQKEWFGSDAYFFEHTSAVPFVAVVQGEQSLRKAITEIGVGYIVIASGLSIITYLYPKRTSGFTCLVGNALISIGLKHLVNRTIS
eukprot:117584_1